MLIFIFFAFLLAGCSESGPLEKSPRSNNKRVFHAPDTHYQGPLEERIDGYLSWHLVYQLNLKQKDWQTNSKNPLINFRKMQEIPGIGSGERIPYVVYYAPPSPTKTGFLAQVIPSHIIQLDNQSIEEQIPVAVRMELSARNIDFKDVPTLVTISILPKENLGDAPIRSNPVSLFPHNWVHDELNNHTDRSIQVASGLYDAYGVAPHNHDSNSNGAIGLNTLKSYGAYVHPVGGRSGFSSRQALFQLDPQSDLSDFWAFSVDVDDMSPHKGSAILMYHIIFTGEQRENLRKEKLFTRIENIIKERSRALDKWYNTRNPNNKDPEHMIFPIKKWPARINAKNICEDFALLSIDPKNRARLTNKLRSLFRKGY